MKHLKHAILLSACAASASVSAQSGSYTVVAAEGLQVPGFTSGVITTDIPLSGAPSWAINQNGVVAYIASRDGASISDPTVNRLWRFDRSASPVTQVAYGPLMGSVLPGSLQGPVDLNAYNDIISMSSLPGGGFNAILFVLNGANYLQGILGTVLTPPFIDAITGELFVQPRLGGEQSVVFPGMAESAPFVQGVWATPGVARAVALEDTEAPGTGGMQKFPAFLGDILAYDISAENQVAFTTRTDANLAGIWAEVGTSNELLLLVLEGDPVPTGGDYTFMPSRFFAGATLPVQPRIRSGTVAFESPLLLPNLNVDSGIFFYDQNLSVVAVSGQTIPVSELDGQYQNGSDSLRLLDLNNSGQILFQARTTASNNGIPSVSALLRWSANDESYAKIAAVGDAAPGLCDSIFTDISTAVMNDIGQVAFYATADTTNGLWMTNSSGQLKLVLVEGQSVELDSAIPLVKTVETMPGRLLANSEFSIADIRQVVLNNDGEVLQMVIFDDESKALLIVAIDDNLVNVCPGCLGDIADDFGLTINDGGGPDGVVDFGDFTALLGLVGPCPGNIPGCLGDIADDFGLTINDGGGPDGVVDFGDFTALLGLIGPCPE